MSVFVFEFYVLIALWFILLGVKVFALSDAVTRKHELYLAADKQSKVFWLVLLGVFTALHILLRPPSFQPLNLIGDVAALVYLVDVRPALRTMHQY
ncbi:MAG: DUF2516 family protein [Nocardioidaceae bacterium]